MPSWRNPTGRSRRDVMALLGITGLAGLAGCIGDGDETTPTPGNGETPTPTPTPPPADRQVMGTYRHGIPSDADTTIPFLTTDTTSGDFQALVLDGAYSVTSEEYDDSIWPQWLDLQLADGSENVYVATLRDNLQWSEPFGQMTADDFVYYIQNIHQAEWTGSVDAPDWAEIEVQQTSELEFEIELPEVSPDWPWEPVMWGHTILPRGAIEDYVDNEDLESLQQDETLIELQYTGNLGPYELVNWERDSAFRTVRNEDWYMRDLSADEFPDYATEEEIEAWQGAPYFEGFDYEIIPEESTRLSTLRTGEIDASNIPETRVHEFQEAVEDVYVNLAPQPYLRVLSFGMRLSGWEAWTDTDPDYDGQGEVGYGNEDARMIRRAIAMAIDKETISEDIEGGLSNVAQTFQPQWSQWYIDEEVEPVGAGETYDPDEARDLLETYLPDGYGYDNGNLMSPEDSDRWGGDQVTLQWVSTAGIETYDLTAEFVQGELEDIGIEMDIETVLWETLLGQWLATEPVEGVEETQWDAGLDNRGHPHETVTSNAWDLLYGINFNTYPRTPAATDVFWYTQAPLNYYGYLAPDDMGPNNDMTMQDMFEAGRTEVDREERLEIFGEIFAQLSHDLPNNFVTMGVEEMGYQERVIGPSEMFGYNWNFVTDFFDADLAP